jgi:hypothetical protein
VDFLSEHKHVRQYIRTLSHNRIFLYSDNFGCVINYKKEFFEGSIEKYSRIAGRYENRGSAKYRPSLCNQPALSFESNKVFEIKNRLKFSQ